MEHRDLDNKTRPVNAPEFASHEGRLPRMVRERRFFSALSELDAMTRGTAHGVAFGGLAPAWLNLSTHS